MRDKDLLRLFLHRGNPAHESLIVSMSGHPRQLADLRLDIDVLAEQPEMIRPLQERPPRCSRCLVTDKQDGTLRPPQIMLEVVLDPPGIAHAACGDDDLRLLDEIDRSGVVRCDSRLQPVKTDRINPPLKQCRRFFVKILIHPLLENLRRFICKRRIHINLKPLVSGYHVFFLDFPDKIEHLLGSAYGK